MLPELLFSVGNSMQDFSKEELNLLSPDKDAALLSSHDSNLARTPDLSESQVESGKLEDSSVFSWHSHDIGSNLLRSSDDPLISGGTQDHNNDNDLSPICETKPPSLSVHSPVATSSAAAASPFKTRKQPKTRRKTQFKLRFHHQALPPEYLNHYEATQAQELQRRRERQRKSGAGGSGAKERVSSEESVRTWLQKISEFQRQGAAAATKVETTKAPAQVTSSGSKVVSYKDLPYMGEMTLENSKPRRGRKPKKADICHLIYKNYGTILPGTPKDVNPESNGGGGGGSGIKSELQTRLMSNLLEKRLAEAAQKPPTAAGVVKQNEPLNLCVRDVNESDIFTMSSSDGEESLDSSRTSPLISPSDLAIDSSLASNLKMSLPNFSSAPSPDQVSPEDASAPPGYIYWPNAGVFVHPMALYYQKMADTATTPPAEILGGGASTSGESKMAAPPQLVPRNIAQLLKEEKLASPPSAASSSDTTTTTSPSSSKRATPVPQKRKRSAIFIPPVPIDASPSAHATEVSICKFKFTGGARPQLQEKKMLSVDAGGNFRYYSGTGDKSTRGYEYFPRESLAQSSLTANSTTSAFLNAMSEKIDLPPPSLGLSNELLQIPEFPGTSVVAPSPLLPVTLGPVVRPPSDRKKRKSKRSLHREKLEKTFKEKGFLIQTQQHQSAEGATYCKFRQLRKFTRYLFRSWKDYLPGELQQGQQLLPGQVPGPPMPQPLEGGPSGLP